MRNIAHNSGVIAACEDAGISRRVSSVIEEIKDAGEELPFCPSLDARPPPASGLARLSAYKLACRRDCAPVRFQVLA